MDIQEHIPLSHLTTFQIDGSARYYTEVTTEEDMVEALSHARAHGLRHVILAGGSNVLVPDEGIDALVIRIVGEHFEIHNTTLIADAGCTLFGLIQSSGKSGLGGWEKLAGIPGTIGGATRGNAGAFGPEIKDFVTRVRALHAKTLEVREFSNAECDFSYRHSFFKDTPEWVLVRVALQLQNIQPEESARIAIETVAEREKRHIQNVKAAGSYFMNPVAPKEVQEMFEKEKGVTSRGGRVPAGWLIEKAGMKGARVGGAIASLQHPNYIVNAENATASDVRLLAEKIKKAVKAMFAIQLQEEAVVLESK
ncbi:MAG TPA: UDP-N-acetylmuramate dehydrogenase [Candidatus Paceibacterota bacterium]